MSKERTITPNSKVPLSVVGSAIGLAVLMTLQWADLKAEVRATSRDAVTEKQARYWIERAREMNPDISLPSLPEKEAGKVAKPDVAFSRRETETHPQ